MLPDYKQNVFVPLKFRHVHLVELQVTFTGGTPTLDATNSSPSLGAAGAAAGGIGITGAAGTYTVNIPKGLWFHPLSFVMGLPADNPGGTAGIDPFPLLSGGTLSPLTGTFTLLTLPAGGGAAASPVNGSRLYITLLVGKA